MRPLDVAVCMHCKRRFPRVMVLEFITDASRIQRNREAVTHCVTLLQASAEQRRAILQWRANPMAEVMLNGTRCAISEELGGEFCSDDCWAKAQSSLMDVDDA